MTGPTSEPRRKWRWLPRITAVEWGVIAALILTLILGVMLGHEPPD